MLVACTSVADALDRTVLPIHEPQPKTITTLDARDATAPQRFEVKAPEGAPNVVIVLIDDFGYEQIANAFTGKIVQVTVEQK
jgi:arylsulfatase